MRNRQREEEAERAVCFIRESHAITSKPNIGLILGTGWGDVLSIEEKASIPFTDIPGFSSLGSLAGHARRLMIGKLSGKEVTVLKGRVHLNEAPDNPDIAKMVRLQVEMLFQLGVRQLIITSAVGSLRGALEVGEIAVVDSFVTVFAPAMPLWAGEFCSPEDALSSRLREIAHAERGELVTKEVGHVMLRGPFFEGRKHDKALLAGTGAGVVGMSMLPEVCVAALYDVETLGLGFVTNDDVAKHSHEENLARAAAASALLGNFLTRIVSRI